MLFLLIPAVSISTYFPCSFSYSVSIASLVVPAIELTIVLFSPNILFINDDFPTFGFPITATFILSSSSSPSCFSGKLSYIASSTSPIPKAFAAETGKEMIDFEGKSYGDKIYHFKGKNAEVIAADKETAQKIRKMILRQRFVNSKLAEVYQERFAKKDMSIDIDDEEVK